MLRFLKNRVVRRIRLIQTAFRLRRDRQKRKQTEQTRKLVTKSLHKQLCVLFSFRRMEFLHRQKLQQTI